MGCGSLWVRITSGARHTGCEQARQREVLQGEEQVIPSQRANTNRCLRFVFLMRLAQGQQGLSGTLTCFMSVARTHSITCFRSASCSCGWKRCAGKQGDGFSYKDKG